MPHYTSFVVITGTPGLLANFLESRNIIKQVDDGQGGQHYVGVLPGMEWVRVPNPIRTDDINESPLTEGPTYDDRAVFLVKFAHESVNDQDDMVGDESPLTDDYKNQFDWTKFGRWVKNNSSIVSAPANYTINGVHAGSAYKITGQNVWLVRDNPERFGVWQ